MAVSQIEEKLLGRLANQTSPSNPYLSASLYQVLGLSILLSRKLLKARRHRKLDTSRDTKSMQLYHHIIWMAREGLSITEYNILPSCQNGEQGPECRVMAAKLRASLYHIFCLFHNQPPVGQLSTRGSPSSVLTPTANNGQTRPSGTKRRNDGTENRDSRRRTGKAPLRDPIPSMTSDTSYVTNPYSGTQTQTPPPNMPPPPIPSDSRRTPTRPPGLSPIDIPTTQPSASFLFPPMNFVPETKTYFETAQHLAASLLSPAHPLRLAVSLEHAAFLRDCSNEPDKARRLARRTIKEVYASSEGLDDEEFADASFLVQALGGIVRRSTDDSLSRTSREQLSSPTSQRGSSATVPPIDRTIAVSPAHKRSRTGSPSQLRSILRTPERLATVPELDSTATSGEGAMDISPPVSRLSSRSRQRKSASSTPSDKSSKRRARPAAAEERADEEEGAYHYRRTSPSSSTSVSGYVVKQQHDSPSRNNGGNG